MGLIVDAAKPILNLTNSLKAMDLLSLNISSCQKPSSTEISSKLISVTPVIAKEWLLLMVEHQRTLSEKVVAKYARAMSQGAWTLSAPLMFDVDGKLIDGQHRLSAVIKSDRAVDFTVLFNMPKNAINGIDLGATRTTSHLAHLQGVSLTNSHISVLNSSLYSTYTDLFPPTLSKQEQVDLGKKHIEALSFASKRVCPSYVSYAPFLAPVARAFYSENHLRLEQFLSVLHTGYTVSATPDDDMAAIALRNLYFRERQNSAIRLNGGSLKRIHDYRKATSALKNFILRKPVKKIQETSLNIFPVADFDAWWAKHVVN